MLVINAVSLAACAAAAKQGDHPPCEEIRHYDLRAKAHGGLI
jgi:hypothetical protein